MVAFDVTEVVQFSEIYFGSQFLNQLKKDILPTWIDVKVAVSLYHQCCARILPHSAGWGQLTESSRIVQVEDNRILPHSAGWGQRHSQLRSGCSIALTGTPIRRHPWNVTISKCGKHKYTAPTLSRRSSFKSGRHDDDRGEDEYQWELSRGSMHCRVREGGRSGFGKTSSGAS